MAGAFFFVEFTQMHEMLLPLLPIILIVFLDIFIPGSVHELANFGVLELSDYTRGGDSHARM